MCPPKKRTAAVLRNPRLRSGHFPARSRAQRGVAGRGDPYRGEGKAPRRATFMQTQSNTSKQRSNLDGQRRPFLRQWARSALRSGRRSAWASPCAATHVPPRLRGNLGKPRRSGRRRGLRAARGVLSHRCDLISGARRRSHRRDLGPTSGRAPPTEPRQGLGRASVLAVRGPHTLGRGAERRHAAGRQHGGLPSVVPAETLPRGASAAGYSVSSMKELGACRPLHSSEI